MPAMTRRKRDRSRRTWSKDDIHVAAEWLDDETWLNLLEPALRNDPNTAETAAHIWNRLIEMIRSGSKGRRTAIAALEDAIRLSYGFTEASKLALEHYRLYIGSGEFPTADEPESLLEEAIRRFRARAQANNRKRKA
jgi:hypothetical protein